MDQGTLIQQHSLALHPNYSLSSDHELEQFVDNSTGYPPAGIVDQLRRDGTIITQSPGVFDFTPSNTHQAARYVPERTLASDTTSRPTTQHFTDSSSASNSTSPASAVSSLAYTNTYPSNHYTSVPTFPGTVTQQQLPQGFLARSFAGTRVSSSFDGCSTSSMLPPPQRHHPLSTFVPNGDQREAYVTSSTVFPQSFNRPGYSTYPETPRSVVNGAAAFSLSPGSGQYPQMSSPSGYGSTQSECANFPWPQLEVSLEMMCDNVSVTPEVIAKVEKGFFLSTADQKWTCYRRNYFSVQCHFELHPPCNNGNLYIKRNGRTERVQATGMRLSAAVDGPNGKGIELIQHTPKRDNGPKTKIDVVKVSPTPLNPMGRADTVSPHGIYQVHMHTFNATSAIQGPHLPHQSSPGENNSSSLGIQSPNQLPAGLSYATGGHLPLPGQNTTHSFERVQFKQATANNGKRRASQQYFHLIVELFGDVRQDGAAEPNWVKIAQRTSEKIVVRGRSPSHYQNEGQNGSVIGGGAGGGGGSRGGNAGNGGVYNNAPGSAPSYGSMNPGAFRSSTGGYGNMSNGAVGGSMYRSHSYDVQSDQNSGSSPESIVGEHGTVGSGGALDNNGMTEAERTSIQEYEGYSYHPSPLYEAGLVPNQQSHQIPRQGPTTYLPPLAKVERSAGFSSEPREYTRQYMVKNEYHTSTTDHSLNGNNQLSSAPASSWQLPASCGRYQGVESSRGYFPTDLGTPYT